MEPLAILAAQVAWPDTEALTAARAHETHGVLGELVKWLAGVEAAFPPRAPQRVRLLRYGTSAEPVDTLAAEAGVGVALLSGSSFEDGVTAADAEVDSGADLLLVTGRADDNACALVASAVTNAEPVAVLPRGIAAIDTKAWIARAEYLRERRAALVQVRDRPDDLLHALDDGPIAMMCGLITCAAARRTPLLLDGDLALAAALIAHAAQPRVASWWRVADTSASPVQTKALEAFQQRPVLDLKVETRDGTAALLALATLRTAAALAATDPAGE